MGERADKQKVNEPNVDSTLSENDSSPAGRESIKMKRCFSLYMAMYIAHYATPSIEVINSTANKSALIRVL